MKIHHVTLQTSVLEEMKSFYTNVLEFPLLKETASSFTLQAGTSLLTFERTEEGEPFYHFAFYLKPERFDEMVARVEANTRVLMDEEGRSEFYAFTWKCRQFYFEDPQRNDVEFLGQTAEEAESVSGPWVHVHEVGMPVPNTQAFTEEFAALPNLFASESESFRFFGNYDGVFVVVKELRHWFPTERPATVHPITVEVDGEQDLTVTPTGTPYRVIIHKSK